MVLAAWHRAFINGRLERQNAQDEQQAAQVAAYEERANRLAIENARRTG